MNTVRTSANRENIRKYQTEATGLKDKITELRNTIERISRRLEE